MPELSIPCQGGLNLQDNPMACPPGTLRDCLNFEVTQQAGYSFRGCWQYYDGTILGTELQDFLYLNITSSWNGTPPVYGERIDISTASGTYQFICIGFVSRGPAACVLILANPIGGIAYRSFSQIVAAAGAGTNSLFAFTSAMVIQQAGVYGIASDPYNANANGLLSSSYLSLLETSIAAPQAAAIQAVPGNPLSSPDCAFLLFDTTYCVHDCIVFNFNSGSDASTRLLEGHVIKAVGGGTKYGTVLSFVTTGGDWTLGTASGYVVVYDVPLATVFPANNTQMVAYSADGLNAIGNIFLYTSAGSLVAYPANSRALLYKTSDQTAGFTSVPGTWSRVPLTREIQYSQAYAGQANGIGFGPVGGAPYSIYEYSRNGLTNILTQLTPINSGPVAGTPGFYGCTNPNQFGTQWTALTNIMVDDGAYATASILAQHYNTYFQAQGVSFADVPVNAAIVGITVQLHWKTTTASNTLQDYAIQLIKPDGTMTVSKSTNTFATTAASYFTYGGPNDMWGYGWKQTDITNANFGVTVNLKNAGAATDTANVDFVGFQVTYVPASRVSYIRNVRSATPTDVPIFIVHYTLDNNTQFASNNGVGTLTIYSTGTEASLTAAGKTRVVGAGEAIYSGPAGTGNLLGWTTSTDTPTSLPCGAALNANGSRWDWQVYNFYSDPSAQTALGCNGVEYGLGFDGTYLIRVRTGRRVDLDNPRHPFGYAGNYYYGYISGDVLVSAPGHPFTVAGLLLSQAYNVGQPITGFANLAGQTIAVFGNRQVFGLQGTDPTNHTVVTLSPALGAFEYTVVNVDGEVMWTSFRGIETMSTTNAYGDFDTVPLSQSSSPWLQQRLQADSRIAIVNQRPVYALAVRNKRQYRLFFADGYTFSLTKFGLQGTPMGMIGAYIVNGVPYVPRHVFQGIKIDGKEVLYACWDTISVYPTYQGTPFVAKLDVGVVEGPAGLLPEGYIEFNPVYPYQQNQNLTPTTQCQYQWIELFSAGMTGNSNGFLNVYSIAGDDVPVSGGLSFGNYQNYPTTAAAAKLIPSPNQTQLFLPIPVLVSGCTIAAYGRMIRVRVDAANLSAGILRIVMAQITYDPQMQERT